MHSVSANGASIPALGFGTFRMPGADVLRMVPYALNLGFRHIDTAQIYGNEAEVGEGLASSGVARGDVFLTTKVWVDHYRRDAFVASVNESLKKLKTDYVDLLLLHWPNDAVPLAEQIDQSYFESSRRPPARASSLAVCSIHDYCPSPTVCRCRRKTAARRWARQTLRRGGRCRNPNARKIAERHAKPCEKYGA